MKFLISLQLNLSTSNCQDNHVDKAQIYLDKFHLIEQVTLAISSHEQTDQCKLVRQGGKVEVKGTQAVEHV